MQIAELNIRINIKRYETVQDATTGHLNTVLRANWHRWAKVEQQSGNRALDQAAINYRETFLITKRFEKNAPTSPNFNIEYGGKEMKIHNVKKIAYGYAWFEEITAYQ